MGKVSRAEFLSLTALLSGAALAPRPSFAGTPAPGPDGDPPQNRVPVIEADLLVVNARVLTRTQRRRAPRRSR